jgi:hypothetical protein
LGLKGCLFGFEDRDAIDELGICRVVVWVSLEAGVLSQACSVVWRGPGQLLGNEIQTGRGARRTCCDKLAIDRVLLLSIPDAAEIFLSPVLHGVLVLLPKGLVMHHLSKEMESESESDQRDIGFGR